MGCGAILMTRSLFLFNILVIRAGVTAGHWGLERLGKLTGLVSGLILIVVGLCETVL